MRLSRRDFIHYGGAIAAASLVPNKVEAWIHGTGLSIASGQTVINLDNQSAVAQYANYFNVFGIPLGAPRDYPLNITANGYPANGTLGTNYVFGPDVDTSYYGKYKIWWTGTTALLFQSSPALVYSGGSSISGNGSNATFVGTSNTTMGGSGASTQPTQASPIHIAWGFLINAVGTNGGLIQFTTNNSLQFGTGVTTGWQGVLNNLTYNGGAFPSGPNIDGSWTITNTGTTTFTLNGSSGLVAANISIVSTGGPGTQTEFILPAVASCEMPSGTVVSGLSGMVWAKDADAALIVSQNALASNDLVNFFKTTAPRFVRVMDLADVQSDRSTGYGGSGAGSTNTYRCNPTNFSWTGGSYQLTPYYVSGIANTGAGSGFSDVYTCSSPSTSPSSGAYQDGETVISQLAASGGTNNGNTPALNVNIRGVAPIFEGTFGQQYAAFWTGTAPGAGTIVTAVFSGAGLNGTVTITYTVQSGDTLQSIYNGIASQAQINSTLTNLGIYTDTNAQGQNGSQGGIYYCPNVTFTGGAVSASLGGANFSCSVTANAGTASYTFGTLGTNQLVNGNYVSLVYVKRMGGWIVQQGATPPLNWGVPLEFYSDLCTRANIGLYLTVGQLWSDQRIYDTVFNLATAGVRELCIELSNETWNAFLNEWAFSISQGSTIGLGSNTVFVTAEEGWIGLRTIQIAKQSALAWAAAGRSRSQLFIAIQLQLGATNNGGSPAAPADKLLGANLNAASPSGIGVALAAFGGPGATAISANYSAFPNRPVDFADAIGQAPYWGGLMLNSGNADSVSIDTNCPLASYNPLLLAAYNFQYGTPTQQAAALATLYSGGATGTGDLYGNTAGGFVTATFTATVVGTALTVSGVTGNIAKNMYVNIAGVPANTYIVNGSGTSWVLSASGSASGASGTCFATGGFQPNFAQTPSFYNAGDTASSTAANYYGIGVVAASFDTPRLSLPAGQVGQSLLGVINYEGGWAFGPASLHPNSDITKLSSNFTTLGYTNGYSSSISGAASGGPTGSSDTAALAAQNVWLMLNGNFGAISAVAQTSVCFKTSSNCYDLVHRFLTEEIAAGKNGNSARVSLATWFGFLGDAINTPDWWSLYLSGSLASNANSASQAVNALAAFGGG